MAVKGVKITLLAACILFSGIGVASNKKILTVVDVTRINYINALSNYEKQLISCADNADKNKLNPTIFKHIKLDKVQLQISIGVFYFKLLNECHADKFGAYLVHRGIYRDTLRQFKAKFDTDNPKYFTDYEIFSTRYRPIEQELKYLSYPKLERDKLEKMPEMKKLFHLFSAIGI